MLSAATPSRQTRTWSAPIPQAQPLTGAGPAMGGDEPLDVIHRAEISRFFDVYKELESGKDTDVRAGRTRATQAGHQRRRPTGALDD
jgi:hypothetical protein